MKDNAAVRFLRVFLVRLPANESVAVNPALAYLLVSAPTNDNVAVRLLEVRRESEPTNDKVGEKVF